MIAGPLGYYGPRLNDSYNQNVNAANLVIECYNKMDMKYISPSDQYKIQEQTIQLADKLLNSKIRSTTLEWDYYQRGSAILESILEYDGEIPLKDHVKIIIESAADLEPLVKIKYYAHINILCQNVDMNRQHDVGYEGQKKAKLTKIILRQLINDIREKV